MNDESKIKEKSSLRKKADSIRSCRCKNLIAVLEEPRNLKNITQTIRNINAFGVESLYVIDSENKLPENWKEMRRDAKLIKASSSSIKWTFVKTFNSTEDCINHLKKRKFVSMVTSPHLQGKKNIILHNGKYTKMKLAVWFGSEAWGLSNEAIENSIACINIPMCGIVESLNLGTSTGIVLYEITKQRREEKLARENRKSKQLK